MSAAVALEPIYGLSSRHIVKAGKSVGLLIPPQTTEDAWEIWLDGEWKPHRFSSEAAALADLGILPDLEIAA